MKAMYFLLGAVIFVTLLFFFYKMSFNEDISKFKSANDYDLNNSRVDNSSAYRQSDSVQKYKVFSEVWSQNSPYGQSYEFKVNCFGDYTKLETCFLWDVDFVHVISPNFTIYNLEKDFNINNYSGEVTRRWVLYGDYNSSLLAKGNYTFEFIVNGSILVKDAVSYEPSMIGYPTNVRWERRANNLYVSWTPPEGVWEDNFYKVIIWEEYGTPDTFISDRFNGTAVDAVLPNVSFIEGGNYSVNVAVYFKNGYAFSEYIKFQW
ncbi:MAG: hypothetical protein AABX10_03690 [Nanoarchaeota archaeon]